MDLEKVLSREIAALGRERIDALRRSSVLIAGIGGLGSAVATYLARMGVGRLVLVDCGAVEEPNLDRQILYSVEDVGRPKAEAARDRLSRDAPWCSVEAHRLGVESEEMRNLVTSVDLVIDALDTWRARRALNRLCIELRKPLIHGGVEAWHGQVTTVIPCRTPCIDCFAPRKEREGVVPVIAPVVGLVAMIQCIEAIRVLSGYGPRLAGRMLIIDAESMEFESIEIRRAPACPTCSRLC